jgi:hypothetical protein
MFNHQPSCCENEEVINTVNEYRDSVAAIMILIMFNANIILLSSLTIDKLTKGKIIYYFSTNFA